MRILNLQFTNINSLAGTWRIDFTDPAYEHGGIFAITGPTGAGKSTILDAICLALYGCTPRLQSVSANENEAMTRLTSFCSAEVTFRTQTGTYRCTWSQRRAHGKPNGKLQPPQHEFVDVATGNRPEKGIRVVEERVIEVTGMKRDQFTRSMLLAQGQFASFLLATANDRGPVLEQITGTGIYSQLSMFVHRRCAETRTARDLVDSELKSLCILSEEDRAVKRDEIALLNRRSAELTEQASELRSMLAWRETVSRLEASLAEEEKRCSDHAARRQATEPARLKLARALQAASLDASYLPLTALRTELKQHGTELSSATGRLPACRGAREEAQRLLDEARTRREEQRSLMERESLRWKRVRELDTTIREKRKLCADLLRLSTERSNERDRMHASLRSLSSALEQIRSEKKGLRDYFDANACDATLPGTIGAILVMIDGIQARIGRRAEAKSNHASVALEHARNVEELGKVGVELRNADEASDAAVRRAAESEAQLAQILCGRDVAAIRSLSAELSARLLSIDEALRLFREMESVRNDVKGLEEKKTQCEARQENGRRLIRQAEDERTAKTKEVDQLEEMVRLISAIDSLTTHRERLQDGTACPLCGSPDHPYAHGQIPKMDEKQEALARAKTELDTVTATLQKYHSTLAAIDRDLVHIGEDVDKAAALLETLDRSVHEICSALDIACESDAAASEAERISTRKAEAERELHAADGAIETQRVASKEAEGAKSRAYEAQIRNEQAMSRFEKSQESLKRAEEDCAAIEHEIEQQRKILEGYCAPYGASPISLDSLAAVGDDLCGRKNAWEERTRDAETMETRERETASAMRSAEAVLESQQKVAGKADEDLRQSKAACETTESERRTLFGEKDPDEEERRMNESAAALERLIMLQTQETERCAAELAGIEKEIEMVRKRIEQCGSALAAEEEEFIRRLASAGFRNEEEFASVRLPEDERTAIQLAEDALRDEGMALESRRFQKRAELEQHLANRITDQPAAIILAALQEAEAKCAEVQQAIGGIESQLRQDEEMQSRQAEKSAAREKLEREYARWNDLSSLIGSWDGNKFRKIAQAVTFEIMIAQANRVLKKMSPRYVLVGDEDLELNIVDQYQAGEIRTTKNLSGGESFIVSLSLALGLSQMASRNVRVDSLFLDEGFGTLDEDALDIALTTLAELQQEGKSIGVISHVGALKERIATQIVVTPECGGRSTLSGPGCRRIN